MRKNRRQDINKQNNLGPWQFQNQSSDEEDHMNAYCHRLLPEIKKQRMIKERKIKPICQRTFSSIDRKQIKNRPRSNVISFNQRYQSNRLATDDRLSSTHQHCLQIKLNINNHQKSNQKPNIADQNNCEKIYLKPKSSNKTCRIEKRPPGLQEVNVQNFLIEGSRQSQRQIISKRKQSSFVMKYKFAQLRKSMNIPISSAIQSHNQHRLPRGSYQQSKNNKQNLILKLVKYEPTISMKD